MPLDNPQVIAGIRNDLRKMTVKVDLLRTQLLKLENTLVALTGIPIEEYWLNSEQQKKAQST